MNNNPYLAQIYQVLPRLLAMFDQDSTSLSYGMGDRFYWAWGMIDFGNGTMQGAAHGLSQIWKSGCWPYSTRKTEFLRRIDNMFYAAGTLTRRNGSLEEAFPYEGSFCVTSLVAFDLLCSYELLEEDISDDTRRKWQDIIAPMIEFLLHSDEKHGIISNHLATAAAAMLRWNKTVGCSASEIRAKNLLDRIYSHQSKEGWFKEYDGADPGYQTLCMYYLADIYSHQPELFNLEQLKMSVKFLSHFAHPDGSFGGIYGSRSTRFYYPSGFEELAPIIPEANILRTFMAGSIREMRTLPLTCMDAPNLVPLFNSYCKAAALYGKTPEYPKPEKALPISTLNGIRHFPEAGLLLDGGESHYTVLSTQKGGCVAHFKGKKLVLCDGGVVVKQKHGALGSSQGYSEENIITVTEDRVIVKAAVTEMNKRLPKPWEFMVLRLLCCTLFRSFIIREWIKSILVKLLITGKKTWPIENTREIRLVEELVINDTMTLPEGYERIKIKGPFVAIHMSSQGYWQIQDEESNT